MDLSEKQHLKKIFDAAAQQAVRDFPSHMSRFVALTEDEIAFVSPKAQALLTEDDLSGLLTKAQRHFAGSPNTAAFTGMTFSSDFDQIHTINLKIGSLEDSPNRAADLLWDMDHEIGHIVICQPDSRYARECASEVYAALRHIQRFGAETDLIGETIKLRSFSLLYGAPNAEYYYHPLALQKVDALKREVDLKTLLPAKAVKLTEEITRHYSLNEKTALKLAATFQQPLVHSFLTADDNWSHRLFNFMMMQKDEEIYGACRQEFTKVSAVATEKMAAYEAGHAITPADLAAREKFIAEERQVSFQRVVASVIGKP